MENCFAITFFLVTDILNFVICNDWQKKRKLRSSLLVLGTGSGDVLALDVSAGELKWRIGDCHPG